MLMIHAQICEIHFDSHLLGCSRHRHETSQHQTSQEKSAHSQRQQQAATITTATPTLTAATKMMTTITAKDMLFPLFFKEALVHL